MAGKQIPTIDQQESELFDLVDENDHPLDKAKARNLVHRDGDWHRAVHAWLVNANAEILMQKRSNRKKLYPGLWHFSLAGHVAAGASLPETCRREFQEELGIAIGVKEINYLFTVKWQSAPELPFKDYEFDYVYLIRKDVPLSVIQLNSEEVSGFKYATIAEFTEILEKRPETLLPQYDEYRKVLGYLQSHLKPDAKK